MSLKKFLLSSTLAALVIMVTTFSLILYVSSQQTQNSITDSQVSSIKGLIIAQLENKRSSLQRLAELLSNNNELVGQYLLSRDTRDTRIITDHLMRIKRDSKLSFIDVQPMPEHHHKLGEVQIQKIENSWHLTYATHLRLFDEPVGLLEIGLPLKDEVLENIMRATSSVISLGSHSASTPDDVHKVTIAWQGYSLPVTIEFKGEPILQKSESFWLMIQVAGVLLLFLMAGFLYLSIATGIVEPAEQLSRSIEKSATILSQGQIPVVTGKKYGFTEFSAISDSFATFTESLANFQRAIEEKKRKTVLVDIARQVAHDIRSPLSALNTATKILRSNTNQRSEALKLISLSASRINAIAGDLLDSSRDNKNQRPPAIRVDRTPAPMSPFTFVL